MTDSTTEAPAATSFAREGSHQVAGCDPSMVPRPRRLEIAGRLNVAVAAGGALGALTRVELDRLLSPAPDGWPWPTFLVNVIGTLLLGYLATRLLDRLPPSTYRRPFAGTGFCGALTTFSTFQVEVVRLLRHGDPLIAVSYAAGSVLCGLGAVFVATRAVRRARWGVS